MTFAGLVCPGLRLWPSYAPWHLPTRRSVPARPRLLHGATADQASWPLPRPLPRPLNTRTALSHSAQREFHRTRTTNKHQTKQCIVNEVPSLLISSSCQTLFGMIAPARYKSVYGLGSHTKGEEMPSERICFQNCDLFGP